MAVPSRGRRLLPRGRRPAPPLAVVVITAEAGAIRSGQAEGLVRRSALRETPLGESRFGGATRWPCGGSDLIVPGDAVPPA
jgi:hypothetical protein